MKVEIKKEQFDPWQELVDYKRSQLHNNPKIGASSVFLGIMRDFNDDETISSMELEYYPDMTEKYLTKIVNDAIKKFKIVDGLVIHRVGLLTPTDPIVLVATWSEHRENAFNATREIMESLKSEAPFWKKESTDKGFRWVEPKNQKEENVNGS
ncbi:MAG: molybdenum cofactor biosynthesis protein MoaE [Pseudomonadota bacterium]|nr:molybdenum cofactor biosynthesis protein MoaE [Pseudomonadota bacterium]